MLWRRFAGARLGALLGGIVGGGPSSPAQLQAENSDNLQTESGNNIYTEGS